MERLVNKREIRRRLLKAPDWTLYPRADLDPAHDALCDWYGAGDGVALAYHAFDPPALVAAGTAAEVRALLAAVPLRRADLAIPADLLPAAEGLWRHDAPDRMVRMVLRRLEHRPGPAVRLGTGDLAEVEELYAQGPGAGVSFVPSQLATGCFFGVRQGGGLVAVAGVHAVSWAEGVAAIGNVFTRPDARGRGLAQIAVSAVAAHLLDGGIGLVGLNVAEDNAPAARAYAKLGFTPRLKFLQGPAGRVGPAEAPGA